MKNDSTKLELSFTTKQISYLAHTSCKSFVGDQLGRFQPHDSSPEGDNFALWNKERMGASWLHWLENDLYLSALIMQQFCIARGYLASVLIDNDNEDKNELVVWTDDPLDMEETS